jgi:hypothetical protein
VIEHAAWVCKCGAGFRWFALLWEHGRDCPDYRERHSGVRVAELAAASATGSGAATGPDTALAREGSGVAASLEVAATLPYTPAGAPDEALPLPL